MQTLLLLSVLSQVIAPHAGTTVVERAPYTWSDGHRSYKLWESVQLVAEPEPTAARKDVLLAQGAVLVVDRPTMRVWKVTDAPAVRTQFAELRPVFHDVPALVGRFRVPVGLVFQSLCGSQKGNDSFGISVGLLDEAYALAKKYCVPAGPNYMYFETGQGSALSADAHNGWDQLTLEARNYGLAKRYSPYQVNTVVGFIGPEYLYDARQIQRAGLEDHFMGKLTGIPMGCDACYTNHARADQNAIENLAVMLTAAGCNYFMGVAMGDDAMLSYQCTSFHDAPSLRQLFNLRPAPEFERWLEELGLMRDGVLTEKAGDPTFFLQR